MRESIGGSWLLAFVVVFIVIFAAFLAFSINYTKAFQTKNKIINIIEENEGYNSKTINKIEEYIDNAGYSTNGMRCASSTDEMEDYGYCVERICGKQGSSYKVTTFISINIPFMSSKLSIPISGETNTIFYTNDVINCS